MNLEKRIKAFVQLGNYLRTKFSNEQQQKIKEAKIENQWFTVDNINNAIINWGDLLTDEILRKWLNPYDLVEQKSRKSKI